MQRDQNISNISRLCYLKVSEFTLQRKAMYYWTTQGMRGFIDKSRHPLHKRTTWAIATENLSLVAYKEVLLKIPQDRQYPSQQGKACNLTPACFSYTLFLTYTNWYNKTNRQKNKILQKSHHSAMQEYY